MKNAITECQMLIRKPIEEVFNAMIDPKVTTQFWFTHSSGKLEKDKKITWKWEMYGVEAQVEVMEIIQNQKIHFNWGNEVTFEYQKISDNQTYVIVKEFGYELENEELIQKIKDSTGGFTTVLDGMKCWLEHRINLNLVKDKFITNIRELCFFI